MREDTHQSAGHPVLSQLVSLIPLDLVKQAVAKHDSDRYYKQMHTYRHLVFILYGVICRCHSLNHLIKSLTFLEGKLSHLGINRLPARSTLSDANIGRSSDVFSSIYFLLYQHYSTYLSEGHIQLFINGEVAPERIELFDSSTISLFVDIFKGAGRQPINGKKKGGLKVHTKLPLVGNTPDFIYLSDASKNDKDFLGQLKVEAGQIYVFDKGYVNYSKWHEWTTQGGYYLTRLNDNANYEVLAGQPNDAYQYSAGGIIADYRIQLGEGEARLVVYKDPLTNKVLKFVTNLFECQAETVAMIYKCRWSIEVLFKQVKQNFELYYFFSDSAEGIKTQVWIALIANLLFSVIHKQVKECEAFTVIAAMASNNLGSHVSLISLVKEKVRSGEKRDIAKVQLDLFCSKEGALFQNQNKSP